METNFIVKVFNSETGELVQTKFFNNLVEAIECKIAFNNSALVSVQDFEVKIYHLVEFEEVQ